MNIKSVLLATLGLVLGPAVLLAQDHLAVCEAVGNLEMGQWAEYHVSGSEGDDEGTLRFALVNAKADKVWYELRIDSNQGSMVLQMLVPGFPFTPDEIDEIVMQPPGQPPMRMPDQMLGMMKQQMADNPMIDFSKNCEGANFIGRESVTVPAGTFDAFKLETEGQDGYAWVSADVPFGLVKAEQPGQGEMELTSNGDDAESSITGEIQEMPGTQGMQPPNNR
jgi:hypothetical protein